MGRREVGLEATRGQRPLESVPVLDYRPLSAATACWQAGRLSSGVASLRGVTFSLAKVTARDIRFRSLAADRASLDRLAALSLVRLSCAAVSKPVTASSNNFWQYSHRSVEVRVLPSYAGTCLGQCLASMSREALVFLV